MSSLFSKVTKLSDKNDKSIYLARLGYDARIWISIVIFEREGRPNMRLRRRPFQIREPLHSISQQNQGICSLSVNSLLVTVFKHILKMLSCLQSIIF